MGVDAAGYIYVADDGNNNVNVLAPLSSIVPAPGTLLFTTAPPPVPVNNPYGLTVDSQGFVYVGNFGGNDILVLASYSSLSPLAEVLVIKPHDEGFADAAQVALDKVGNMYVTDFRNNRVAVLASVTSTVAAPGTELFSFNRSTPPVNGPQGVALDGNGSI